tara:strand:- start:26754 stop:26975 length:222 start_codon:yes stop_codon:yes gene_type:complete
MLRRELIRHIPVYVAEFRLMRRNKMTLILVGLASGMLLIFAASVIRQRSELVALDADVSAVHDLRKTSEGISS